MLCIFQAANLLATLASLSFTVSWTHSVEQTSWQEDWQIRPAGLFLVEARIQGSGAGMEPPPSARLAGGWWVYSPSLPPLPELVLAASGATGAGWQICGGDQCFRIGENAGEPVRLRACPGKP